MEHRKLPIGIQSFEKIRNDNYLYVDKTEYIWNLVQNGTVYFLSRPRRFGKSLLTSTLEAYFLGKKELFKGLYIEQKEKEWIEYPVIHIDFTGGEYQSETGLNDMLANVLKNIIRQYDLSGEYAAEGNDIVITFSNVINQIYRKTGKHVVVLVDEYDKPLLETMEINPEQEEKNKQLFKSFFGVLKGVDACLKFTFFTGISRFEKVSVFSDLNHLKDISLTDAYACICGITEEEMVKTFQPEINEFSRKMKVNDAECIRRLADMYDGYRFSPDGTPVYNPFSLLNALQDHYLRKYWFSTGTPAFLIHKLENSDIALEQLVDGITVDEDILMNYLGDNNDPIPLFYQAGYLTIKDYDFNTNRYTLVFPNREVKYGFLNTLVPSYFRSRGSASALSLTNIQSDLENGRVKSFMSRLKALFSSISYPSQHAMEYEQFWRDQMFLIMTLAGENTACEVHTSQGRIDCIAETKDYIYLFEFKLDKSAEEALKQIEEKGYGDRYKADQKKLYKIGVNFSSEKRNIEDYKVA